MLHRDYADNLVRVVGVIWPPPALMAKPVARQPALRPVAVGLVA
jgi:hypothetical protein